MAGEPLYNFAAARTAGQLAEMRRLDDLGLCCFCPEGIAETKQDIVADDDPHWIVLRNPYPYPDTAEHLLIAPRRHVTTVSALTSPEWFGFDLVVLDAADCHQGWELRVRSGDMGLTGATVAHIHWHVIVPAA